MLYVEQGYSFEFPLTKDFRTAALFVAIAKRWRATESFYADPMTEAYGAPCEDFQEDFNRKERKLLCELLDRSEETRENNVRRFALSALEKFMP